MNGRGCGPGGARADALRAFLLLTSWRVTEAKVVCSDLWKLVKHPIAELTRSLSFIFHCPFWRLFRRRLSPEWIGLHS